MDLGGAARRRGVFGLGLALLSVGCGGQAEITVARPTSTTASSSVRATASPTAIPSPTPAPTPAPSPSPALTRTSSTFPIRPLVAGGPTGSVTVTSASGGVHLHVVVAGLAPGSTHAIHDQLGTCAEAGQSAHLTVLAVVTAGTSGLAVADATVSAFDAGANRIVIVYSTADPVVIVGCADL